MENQENKILAEVEGRKITQNDLNELYRGLKPEHAAQFNTPDGVKQLVKELVHQEMLLIEAEELKFAEEKEFIDEVERLKKNLLKQYAMKKIFETIQIEDSAVKDYYEKNEEQFKSPLQVKASHILVNSEEEILEIEKRIKAGESFEEVAKEKSMCPSKQRGGDLGFFERGKMVPEFDEKVFDMEVDEISEPIKTQFGYHLIKKTEVKPEGSVEFDQVSANIKNQLFAMEQNKKYVEKIGKLEERFKAEYHAE